VATVGPQGIADFFGVEKRTVTNWINESPPCPSWKDGTERLFDTVKVAAWREERAARKALAATESTRPADFEEARTRKMAAEAQLAEIEVAEKQGQVVPIAVLESEVAAIGSRLRAVLINTPSNYTVHLERAGISAAAAQDVLERLSEELTRALRKPIDDLPDEPEE
jgi:terminase small subunit / prophage DNA-packing protein